MSSTWVAAGYTSRMILDIPRQPRGLDSHDESALASIGHRIESWQRMKDSSIPFEERKEKMLRDLRTERETLRRDNSVKSDISMQVGMLEEDIDQVMNLVGNDEEIAERCDPIIEYYIEVRRQLLRNL